MKRSSLALAICIQFIGLFWWGMGVGVAGECGVLHTVKAGETLTAIGASYGVSVAALVERNHIRRPNLIRIGQELCIPLPLLPTVTPENGTVAPAPAGSDDATVGVRSLDQPSGGLLQLVAEFRLTEETPAAEPSDLLLLMHSQPLGMRYPLRLAAGRPADMAQSIFQTPDALKQASAAGQPALWLIPNVPNLTERVAPSYTLALIGLPAPLLALQFGLTPTQTITELLKSSDSTGGFGSSGCKVVRNPVSVLGKSSAAQVEFRVELSGGADRYIGYTVTDLAYWSSPTNLAGCDVGVALALQSATEGDGYRLLLALPRSTGGPTPGEGTDADCQDWEGVGGVFALLRILWGCPD